MAETTDNSQSFSTDHQHVGAVYAKALLAAAQNNNATDQVLEEFGSFLNDVLSKLPVLEATLASPRVDHPEKTAILDKAVGGKMMPVLLNFLKVVARHGRLDCLRAIHHAFVQQYNELRGRREVFLRTAEPVSDQLHGEIADRLRQALGADVDLKVAVDPELIGGMVIRVGDTLYDGSIANRLKRAREEMLAKTTEQIRTSLDKFLQA